ILSPESKQLINIFFLMSEKKKNPMTDLVRPVNTIAMLGAGFMGAGIAEVSITNNMNVLLKDIKPETLAAAQKSIWETFSKRVKRRAMSKVEAIQTLNKITPQLDYTNFTRADVIIEAVFEDLNLKQRILADCEANARPDTIFASNTSALPISEIAKNAKRPELVIGMHYFSPVPKMPLLEIVKTPQTADWVVATCLQVGINQGKTCIVVKDGPGFYTTRILAPFLNEALLLLEEGATIDQLDSQMKQFGYPVGPVALMDEVGIDVGAHIMSGDLMKAFISQRKGLKISEALLFMHKDGYHGRKNRKGFYLYDPKTGRKVKGKINTAVYDYFGGTQTRRPFKPADIQQRMAMAMVNEAALCLQEGIVESPLDGDVGAVFGLGFPPFRGGPFRFTDSFGVDNVVKVMQKLQAEHGDRFTPAPILLEYAAQGEKFYP
ncbi:MAG TPA: 3-hydroxyacyl-CoA dehydrogenase NAD-binding domain-containing protein, partial [Chitinophagales bacterium]|nr:3-hydroxyacyl-CoA dehydrogenase NAD-binding domain-containing protein [Chitinophagales bacterium]